MPNVGEITVQFTGDTKGLQSSTDQAIANLQKFAQAAESAGGAAAGGASAAGGAWGALSGVIGTVAPEAAPVIDVFQALKDILGSIKDVAEYAFNAMVAGLQACVKDAMEFEEAFSTVRKTLEIGKGEDAGKVFKDMGDDLVKLSQRIPVAATELAKIAGVGAQMNIARENLMGFTETVARLAAVSESKNVEELALQFGRLQAQTGASETDFARMASTTVLLAMRLKATEGDILRAATSFASMAHMAGMSTEQILGLAAASTNLDRRVQTAGTALMNVSRVYFSALTGGPKADQQLSAFARVLDVTKEKFTALARADAGGTFQKFIENLGPASQRGVSLIKVMGDLGFAGSRVGTTMLNLAQDSSTVTEAFKMAHEEWASGALIFEASNKRWETATQQLQLLKNEVTAAAIGFGQAFVPAITAAAEAFQPVMSHIADLSREFRDAFGDDITSLATSASQGVAAALTFIVIGLEGLAKMGYSAFQSLAQYLDQFGINLGNAKAFVGSFFDTVLSKAQSVIPGMSTLVGQARELVGFITHKAGIGQGQIGTIASIKGNVKQDLQDNHDKSAKEAAEATKAYETALHQVEAALHGVHTAGATAFEAAEAGARFARDEAIKAIDANQKLGAAQKATLKGLQDDLYKAKVGEATQKGIDSLGASVATTTTKLRDLYQSIEAATQQAPGGVLNGAQWTGIAKQFEEIKKGGPDALAAAFSDLESKIPGASAQMQNFVDTAKGLGSAGKNWSSLIDAVPGGKPWIVSPTDPSVMGKGHGETANAAKDSQKALNDEVKKYDDLLRGANDLLKALGINADSTIGRLITGFAAAGKVAADLKLSFAGIFSHAKDANGNNEGPLKIDWKKMAAGAGQMISSIAGIVGAFKQATDSASGFQRALGGAMLGAQIGSQFGGGIGAAIGAAIGGLAGIFHKPSWAAVGKEAGRVLGVEIGKEMAQEIEKLSKSLHISVASASLLKLPDVMKDSGKNVSEFSSQIDTLMHSIVDKSVPAAEGIKALGEAFSQVKEQAESMGGAANAQLVHMIQQARQMGTMTKEMTAYVNEQIDKAVTGLGSVWGTVTEHSKKGKDGKTSSSYEVQGGLKINTEEDAKASATIFASVFAATLKTRGIAGAAAALKDTFAKLKDNLKAAGFEEMATKMLAPIQKFFDYADNDAFKGASDSAQGLADALSGIAQSGYLSQEAMDAFGHSAQQGFEQALAATGDEKAALMSQMPLLTQLKKAHDELGYTYTDEEQKLMDMAAANGLAFPTDPIIQVRDAIYELIEAITGVPRDISVTTHFNTEGAPPGSGGPQFKPGGPGGENENGAEQHASLGFFSPRLPKDTLIQAHAGEPVAIGQAAWGQPMSGGSASSGGNTQGGPIHYAPTIHVNVPNTNARPRDIAEAVEKAIRNNTNGVATKVNRALKNGKGGRA